MRPTRSLLCLTVMSIAALQLAQAQPAEAGSDQTVNEGELVTLDGSESTDPDNDPLTYQWTQLAGPTVTLDITEPVHPTFYAPLVPVGGATLTFELVVNDGQVDSEPDIVNVTVKNVNNVPVADAGSVAPVAEYSPVTLDGSASYDLDTDPLTCSWVQMAGPTVTLVGADTAQPTFTAPFVGPEGAMLTFELTVSDGLDSDSDTVDVIVENVNHDPTAEAGPDQTREEGALVTLDGTASSDPDADALTYELVQLSGPEVTLSDPTSPTPSFTAPAIVGSESEELTFELTADDGYGGSASDAVVITVLDINAPPACDLAQPSADKLWPPNHKMHSIGILAVTDPEDGDVQLTILEVTQDEPVDGLGDGDTAPDAIIQDGTVLIRAERAGNGNGRVYGIHFEADDGVGGVCTGTVTVCVPHSKKSSCVDDGQFYNSLASECMGPAPLEWTVRTEPVMSPPCNDPANITVLYDDGVYKMWHDGGQSEQLEVMYSWSIDGFDWACSEHAYFPSSTNDAVPKVVKRGGTYYMWVGQTGGETSVDFAVSADGESWTHAGWVADWFHYDILPTESGFKAWFTSFDDPSGCYRYATSEDGLNWTDHGCVMPAGDPGEYDEFLSYVNVIDVCGLYHMWYNGSQSVQPAQHAYATSDDGMTWQKHGLLEGFEALPDVGRGAPAVLQEGNQLRMWFLGTDADHTRNLVYYAQTYFTAAP